MLTWAQVGALLLAILSAVTALFWLLVGNWLKKRERVEEDLMAAVENFKLLIGNLTTNMMHLTKAVESIQNDHKGLSEVVIKLDKTIGILADRMTRRRSDPPPLGQVDEP